MATTAELIRPKTGLKIIDADTHLSEPHDLWTKRAPAKLRDRVPQVKMHDGKLSWVIDGDKLIGRGASPSSAIKKDGSKERSREFLKLMIDEVHPGSFDGRARVKLMDEVGIWAQIVYPNILGFGGEKSAKVDPELRLASTQIYNDAVAELQNDSNQRLFPMALLPWWDVRLAVAEAERCAKMGLRGVNTNADPQYHLNDQGERMPDLGHPYWNPLWEVCVANDLPVNFHIGASEQSMDWTGNQGWPSLHDDKRAGLTGAMLFFDNGRIMGNVIYSGVLDRYPKLKFISVESGIGWIPFLLESLDYQYREFVPNGGLQKAPSEYFKSNFYACYWFEQKNFVESVRQVGVDNVMFETDFPHPTCLYPINQETYELPGLTNDERAKILSGNASRVYNIPVG